MSATTTSGCSSRTSGRVSVGGLDDGLVEVQRLGARGEDLVLGRRREGEALGLDVLAPARPGLQRDLVAAGRERAPERDHREGVAGVAEGAQQHTHASGRRELGHEPQLLQALGRGERDGGDPERADAGVAVDGQALANARREGRTARRCR